MTTEFRLLGPVEVSVLGRRVPLSGQPLTLLAGLLLRANTAVQVGVIEQWLWSEADTPRRARAAVQTYVLRLRRALGDDVVRTVPGGYRVDADAATLDVLRFAALAEQASTALAAGQYALSVEAGAAALAEWRGEPLTGIDSEALHRDEAAGLAERKLDVWQDLLDARLALGDPPIAELHRLVRENPLRERFAEQLVLALYRDGRQADALAAYRRAAAVLAEEAGLEPGPRLRELQRAVLAADPVLTAAPGPAARRADDWVSPHQLPLGAGGFVGRDAELAVLAGYAAAGGVVAVEGTAGVGKTALTVHFGHRASADFPDGQVYLNLHGYGPGQPRDERSALELLLLSVGIDAGGIPADNTARQALWRTVTAQRRLLVVLDNARSTEHVRPLLPGRGGLVIVTSRAELRGLVARDGASRLTVDRLDRRDARALLAGAVGDAAVAGDPEGCAELLRRCANLPLAVRILGEQAGRCAQGSLSEFMAGVDARGLAQFDLDDGAETDLRAVFAPSYAALEGPAARLFRSLGMHPGPEFGVELAAALLAVPYPVAQRRLAELVRAHLLEQPAAGRYQFHDLLRDYAAELARSPGDGRDAGATESTILGWYLASARAGQLLIIPESGQDGVEVPHVAGVVAFADRDAAVSWFDREWANLVAAVHRAAALGDDELTWRLTRSTQSYLVRSHRGQFDDWQAIHELGLVAARTLGDAVAEGFMLSGLGARCNYLREYARAADFCEQRLAVATRVGDRWGEQATLTNLGIAYQKLGRYEAAREVVARSAELAGELGKVHSRALALANLAEINGLLERREEAAECARLAYELYPGGETLYVLGLATAGLGDLVAGADLLRSSVTRHRADGELNAMADAAVQLAELHRTTGDVLAARAALAEALAAFERLGHPDAEATRATLAELDRSPVGDGARDTRPGAMPR